MEVISTILLNINFAFKQIVHTYERVLFIELFYIYFKLFCSRTNVCTTVLFFLGFLFTFSTFLAFFWLFCYFGSPDVCGPYVYCFECDDAVVLTERS